jgi:hypothetical protein
MSVTEFRKAPPQSPAQKRIEAIVKVAADLGMGGFALAKLRTAATEQIEPLTEALKPFAAFSDKAAQFVDARAKDGEAPIMPTKDFRLSDFQRASDLLKA